MTRIRTILPAVAGFAATLIAALALAAPAGAGGEGPPFIVKVAKDKQGPYQDGFSNVNLQGGQVKDFFFRVRNKEPEPFINMTFEELFGPAPKGLILKWFKGDTNVTSDVQGDGHSFNLPGDGRRFFELKAKAEANNLYHCLGGEADFENTISDFAFLQFNTVCD